MKSTSLLQFVDKLQQAGGINKLQQVDGVFRCECKAICVIYVDTPYNFNA